MTRIIDHDPSRGLLRIQFPYEPRLVEVVRGLPGRRWDANAKAWMVPAIHLWGVISALGAHGFELSGEAAALLNTLPKPSAHQPGDLPPPDISASLSAILGQSKPAIHSNTPVFQSLPSLPTLPPSVTKSPDPPAAALPTASALDRAVAFVENLLTPPQPKSASTPSLPLGDTQTTQADTSNTFSVSAINHRARQVLRAAFPDELWVVGELSGYTRGLQRSFMSFELLERPSPDVNPIAQIQAVLPPEDRRRIEQRLRAAGEPFTLQDGLQVRLRVSIDFYTNYGKFQVIVRDIEPAYTLGQLAVRRDEILRQLAALSLLHQNRDLPMPWLPLRLALMTSPQGEAVQDFLHGLRRTGIGFQVTLFGIRVQGPRLVPDLCAALDQVAHQPNRFDAVVIIRGGGSRADLAWFDHIDAALAVARLPLKVIVGIGHQRDQSVLDMIAHSEKTPTAASEFLVRCVEDALASQDHIWSLIQTQAISRLRDASGTLTADANTLTSAFRRRLSRTTFSLERLQTHLTTHSLARVQRARQHLTACAHDLQVGARLSLRAEQRALSAFQDRLQNRRLFKRFARAQETLTDAASRVGASARDALQNLSLRLDTLDARRRLLDPLSVMARGYARVSTSNGTPVGSIHDAEAGDTLKVTLRDGHFLTTIKTITQTPTQILTQTATGKATADVQEEVHRTQLPASDVGASPNPRRNRGRRHRP